jgi:hypothetical protein
MVCNVNDFINYKGIEISTYKLIDWARVDDRVRNFTEERIPDLLHGCRYNLDVVLERIILPGDIHHECREEIMAPNLTIALMWQMFILEFLEVGVHRSGFVFGHKSLFRGELKFSTSCSESAYLAG